MKPLSEKTYVDQALMNRKGITWLDDCRIPYESDDVDTRRTIGGFNAKFSSVVKISGPKIHHIVKKPYLKKMPMFYRLSPRRSIVQLFLEPKNILNFEIKQ